MTLTTPEARKQMFDRIDSVWSTQAAAIAGALPEMRYQGVKEAAKPGADPRCLPCGPRSESQADAVYADGPGG